MSKMIKIIFIGLDFAGKSSILKILGGTYSELDRITPTKGTDRVNWNVLGFKVMNWDLGGQQRYREKFLADHKQILDDVNFMVFVVDIHDENRFSEAGAYFDDILDALDNLKIKCPITLCIHKVDPDIIDSALVVANINRVTNRFSEYAEKHDVELKIFTTTIYDRTTLTEMFSYAIEKLMPVGILSQILEKFIQETEELGAAGTIILDNNFFSVGNAFINQNTRNFCYKTINAFFHLLNAFKRIYKKDQKLNYDITLSNDENYQFNLNQIMDPPYYVIIMGKQTSKIDEMYSIFHEKYVPQIEKSLGELTESID